MTGSKFHVIIIGAGTGGMCLAHGLRRAGISVAVYERHRHRSDGLYGYRVGIDRTGSYALNKCLSPDLYATFVATCAREPRYFTFLDEQLRSVLDLKLRELTDEVGGEKSVSRMTLRQVLLTDADDMVHFDKVFTRYEQNADGTVTAFFEDGTSATGDLLVAADGTRSRVRQQYLPHAKTLDAGIISITAKVPMNEQTKALLPPHVFQGIGLMQAPHGYSCILHSMEFNWDRDGRAKNNIGGNEAELLEKWPGLLYDNTRDYINWGFWASTDKFPGTVMQMRPAELVALVKRMCHDWHPNMHKLFDLADLDSCFPINIQTSVPIPQWKTTNVTLLGDAIHTMTPGMGVGANTALRDAALLRKRLIEADAGQKSLLQAVNEYETKMIKYGFEAVLKSRKLTSGDQITHKPVVGRVALAATRTALRVAERVPAMKAKILDGMYDARSEVDD
ncbi:FAD-dependent oxidoreductase [Actinoplanes siamensis]|uniref:Monooxygenase n=1 Tax=Actinoplanes siamensis TaxID=1223317 RepID=A0A919NA42_9ACTN|nr:FAD-dependent monooxygenase [Actinoplanes siamensis]GIF07096.1 monooxygenase [Actinoplanes siamensis]